MKFGFVPAAMAAALCCAILSGCQPWRQLNENAVGQSSSVASLLEKSAVRNLVLFYLNHTAIPSQINVGAGSVSTTDQASIGANDPVNRSLTTTLAATTQVTTALASQVLSPSLSNQQVQSWTLGTVTSPDILDRLTALYRYVTVPGADLCREYPEVMVASNGATDLPADQSKSDSDAWSAATAADDLSAYDAYKAAFPRGQHLRAANLLGKQIRAKADPKDSDEHAWTVALKADTAYSYGQYRAFLWAVHKAIY